MGSSAVSSARSLLEPTYALNEELTHGRGRSRGAGLWSADHVGRSTRKGGQTAQFLVWTLLSWPPCYVCGSWLVLRRFGSSGGPVDPRERVWFVEKVFPRIDDVSPCLWAAFLLVWGCKMDYLILVLDRSFIPWIILDSLLHFWPRFICTHSQTCVCGIH